mmetsp:Transcript_21503/g.49306  ORF Transcript_21503/g.49306 Transcript_21503/m.49306 type:complete len:343 (+) Transcript_21503:210-1238(+)
MPTPASYPRSVSVPDSCQHRYPTSSHRPGLIPSCPRAALARDRGTHDPAHSTDPPPSSGAYRILIGVQPRTAAFVVEDDGPSPVATSDRGMSVRSTTRSVPTRRATARDAEKGRPGRPPLRSLDAGDGGGDRACALSRVSPRRFRSVDLVPSGSSSSSSVSIDRLMRGVSKARGPSESESSSSAHRGGGGGGASAPSSSRTRSRPGGAGGSGGGFPTNRMRPSAHPTSAERQTASWDAYAMRSRAGLPSLRDGRRRFFLGAAGWNENCSSEDDATPLAAPPADPDAAPIPPPSSSSFAAGGRHRCSTIDAARRPATPMPDVAASLPGSRTVDQTAPTAPQRT